jgi:hypothetical protein
MISSPSLLKQQGRLVLMTEEQGLLTSDIRFYDILSSSQKSIIFDDSQIKHLLIIRLTVN